jgi:hypothetical protein
VEEIRQIYSSELEVLKAQLAFTQAKAMLYSTSSLEKISLLWTELQDLRQNGDRLWEAATPSALSRFSEQLISSKLMLEKSSLFISTDEYADLITVLEEFERFQLGKQALISFRTSKDVELVLENFGEIPSPNDRSPMIEKEIIQDNSRAKARYESLLKALGDRVRSQLDVSLSNIDDEGLA